MSVLKYYNPVTEAWEPAVIGKQGPSGVITTTAPITNSGTETSANIGIDRSQLASVSGNAIINGAFDIWQRGTSFTTTGTYTADRWNMVVAGSGSAVVSRQAFTPGAAPEAGYESTHFLRYASTNVTDPRIFQPIEDVRTFAGQTVTVSFWAKSDISDAFSGSGITLQQNFGSGGSTQVSTITAGPTVTSDWERYSFTLSLPSISGKTIGANSNLRLQISFKGSATFNVDIWGVQVEAGSVATPFRRNANSLQGELAACQRYYFRYSGTGSGQVVANLGTAASTTLFIVPTTIPEMRVNPTSVGMSDLAIADGVTTYVVSGVSLGSATPRSLDLRFTSSTLTQYRPGWVRLSSATGFLEISAEL
jgi:hypothetical protein